MQLKFASTKDHSERFTADAKLHHLYNMSVSLGPLYGVPVMVVDEPTMCGFYPLVRRDCFDIFPETWAWEITPLCMERQRDMLAVMRST
jgi:hypothetical protein